MDPVISVIVPCFNSANYVSRCLDSLSSSRSGLLEFVLVDDGSTDNLTLSILLKYAKLDPRFIVFTKTNGGYPSAINLGISKARGEYIIFLGSDDAVEPSLFDCLLSEISSTHPDILVFRTVMHWPDGRIENDHNTIGIRSHIRFEGTLCELTRAFPEETKILSFRDTSKCFKRCIIGDVRETGRFGVWADNAFSVLVEMKARCFAFLPLTGYHLYMRSDSVSNRKRNTSVQIDVVENQICYFESLMDSFMPSEIPAFASKQIYEMFYDAYCCGQIRGKQSRVTYKKAYKTFYSFLNFIGVQRPPFTNRTKFKHPRITSVLKAIFRR